MGATRESSWSAGILEVCADVPSCRDDITYARASPGVRAMVHRITNKFRKVAPFRFAFMGTSPQRSCGQAKPPVSKPHRVWKTRGRSFHKAIRGRSERVRLRL